MELHEKIYFDLLLNTAVERFTERIIQRKEGVKSALEALKDSPDGEGVWLSEFVEAFFEDMLLNNTAGAVYILEALEKRLVSEQAGGKVSEVLLRMAKQMFKELLRQKAQEALEQSAAYST
jgi:hypothetical protein